MLNTPVSIAVEIDLRETDDAPMTGWHNRQRDITFAISTMTPGTTLKLIVNRHSWRIVNARTIAAAVPDGVRVQLTADDPYVAATWRRRLTEPIDFDELVAQMRTPEPVQEGGPW